MSTRTPTSAPSCADPRGDARLAARAGAGILLSLLLCPLACGGSCGSDAGGVRLLRRIGAADELIGGRDATGRLGDFLLANERVRFIVQDSGSSTGWGVFGGSLVDLDARRGPGAADGAPSGPADDRFGELFYQCDLRGFEPKAAEIVADGSDGGPAVLRLTGPDRGIPYLDAVLPTEPLLLGMSVEYTLAPGSDTLEITLRARDERLAGSRELTCGAVLVRGDSEASYLGDGGSSGGVASAPLFVAGAAADSDVSWVLYRDRGPWSALAPQADVVILSTETRPFVTGATIEERFFLSVGERGDVESALAAMRARLGPEPVVPRVVEAAIALPGDLAAWTRNVELSFFDATRPDHLTFVTQTRAGRGSSTARAALPPGSYLVRASLFELDLGETELEVPAGGPDPIAFTVSGEGTGVLHVRGAAAERDGSEPRPSPVRLRLDRTGGGSVEVYARADDRLPLREGHWQVTASLGPEHELDEREVDVVAGQTAELSVTVRRAVDTTGWIAADFHVHSTRSVDAQASRESRVLGAIAEGLDLLVATDHDTITDLGPVAAALGLTGRARFVSGIEMSMLYGHMNGFPLPARRPEAYFQPSWTLYDQTGRLQRMLEPVEVSRALREDGAQVVQVNHPRDGQGVFNYIDLDPATGASSRDWPEADACEVLNGKRLALWSQVLADYHGIVRAGRRITMTGTSDAHGTLGVGYARTMVRSASDDPASLDDAAIWRAIREGRAVATNGPFLEVTASGGGATAEIGDTLIAAPGDPVSLDVQVQAPTWIDVGRIVIYENGGILTTRDLTEADVDPTRPAVRFRGTFTATSAADAYYLVMVEGHPGVENRRPHGDESRTIGNAIFVDRGGDGFTPR